MQLELEPEVIQSLLSLQTAQLAHHGVETVALRGTIAALEMDRRARGEELEKLRTQTVSQQALIDKLQALLSQVLHVEFTPSDSRPRPSLVIPKRTAPAPVPATDNSDQDVEDAFDWAAHDTSLPDDYADEDEDEDEDDSAHTDDSASSTAASVPSSSSSVSAPTTDSLSASPMTPSTPCAPDVPNASTMIVPFSPPHEKGWKRRFLVPAKPFMASRSALLVLSPPELRWSPKTAYPAVAHILRPAHKLSATGATPVPPGPLAPPPGGHLELVLDAPGGRAYLGTYTAAPALTLSPHEYTALSSENRAFVVAKSASHSMRGQPESLRIPGAYLSGERVALSYELVRVGYNDALARSFFRRR